MRDLSLHLLDIMQNSVAARASKITVRIAVESEILRMVISDNGCGMDEAMLQRVTDPFVTTRTTRSVGLGLPLLHAATRQAAGDMQITSALGKGTTVTADFVISHVDRPPLGDIADTYASMVAAHPDIEFDLFLSGRLQTLYCSTQDIKNQLDEVPITHFEVISWLRSYVNDYIKELFGGVLDEIDC